MRMLYSGTIVSHIEWAENDHLCRTGGCKTFYCSQGLLLFALHTWCPLSVRRRVKWINEISLMERANTNIVCKSLNLITVKRQNYQQPWHVKEIVSVLLKKLLLPLTFEVWHDALSATPGRATFEQSGALGIIMALDLTRITRTHHGTKYVISIDLVKWVENSE